MTAPPATAVTCRPGCAACCIAPSISTPIPARDGGAPCPKPADQACQQLDGDRRCRLFGLPQRPRVCSSLQPSVEMCGSTRQHAMLWLSRLERQTRPDEVLKTEQPGQRTQDEPVVHGQ